MPIEKRRNKINLRQKKLLSMKKRDLENRNTDLKKQNKTKCKIIIWKQQHLWILQTHTRLHNI